MAGGGAVRSLMDDDRLNSPDTSSVNVEVLGHHLQFSQISPCCHQFLLCVRGRFIIENLFQDYSKDPNSKHHGTTVWDASMVFVKFLEKNRRKGRFSPSKLKGKRAIELGAGCGLAGFGMALLGCDVIATDQAEVLPLLTRNVERNMSRVIQANSESASVGSIKVAELDWRSREHAKATGPPFDFIIGTDVVYSEALLEPLLQTIFTLSEPRTTILMCSEIRSTSVHEQMIHMWNVNFEVTSVPRSKMDPKYQHPSIQLHVMTMKSSQRAKRENSNVNGSPDITLKLGLQSGDGVEKKTLDDWESRRLGSEAARLLKDVNITTSGEIERCRNE